MTDPDEDKKSEIEDAAAASAAVILPGPPKEFSDKYAEDEEPLPRSESFASFSQEDKAFLAALPYRVGLWISHSDQSGGGEADEAEKQALHTLVVSYVEDMCKAEFVQHVMEETVARRGQWDEWATGLEKVPEECARSVKILKGRLVPKDLTAFCANLMEIAQTVAMAYREEEAQQQASGGFAGRIMSLFGKGGSSGSNISSKERQALDRLAEVLAAGNETEES